MRNNAYQSVSSLKPGNSVFDLSYAKKFTCDMGQLIPILIEEVVPGDRFTIGNQALIRFQPLVAPIMHSINMYVHYFYVPYRLLWPLWEEFITRGSTGDVVHAVPEWDPQIVANTDIGTLWDYCGFPTGIIPDVLPVNFPMVAYNLIWNQYYRDENLQTEVPINASMNILKRNWEKDYFTSSLPWQQKGTAPALPVTGLINVQHLAGSIVDAPNGATFGFQVAGQDARAFINGAQGKTNAELFFNSLYVDLASAATFDVSDLRVAFQIQRWMERNARAGSRYTEFLKSHFGVAPRDERLQRAEYIGGTRSPVIISEVLQTSSTDATSPQGNLAGHGMTLSEGFAGKIMVPEYGLIMGIMSVMPRTGYSQGINRQWLRKTTYDYYFPEFANLSEQAIQNVEVCATGNPTDANTFGYQGRYDEMRTKSPMYCGQMRSTFNYWHLGREFNPAAPPALNSSFIECNPRKDIFAVPAEPGLLVEFGNLVKAIRPLPISAEPGLIDHD